MKTIELVSTEQRNYTLEVPDENYTKVVELLTDKQPKSGKINSDAIKRYTVQFLTSKYFSEELQSLCECDITDESYSLSSLSFLENYDE